MHLNCLVVPLLAQAESAPQQPPMWTSLPMLIGMIVIFYFLLIRPQQKKAKEHAALLKTVKPNDRIVTSGGIVGIVIAVKEKNLTIRSADTKLEITKSAIAEITERGAGESKES